MKVCTLNECLNFEWIDVEDICDAEYTQILKLFKKPTTVRSGTLTFVAPEPKCISFKFTI